ncbi:FtsL-like putative cell division protein [Flavobacteriaceae bacterium]|nr:FtsL-like putative cell division protein [Flavobacteriaceae bacterium]
MNKLLSILNIEFLIRNDALKNWRMILFLSVLALIMIGSGHSADRKIFKIAALNAEIKALKSDFIESKKQLLVLRKETNITRVLTEKGVGPAKTPPIKIVLVNE